MARGHLDSGGLSQSDVSNEERNKLVAEMMRYMLFKNYQHPGIPVKREELTQLVTKNYRQRNLPTIIINQAQKKFASIFGYEMKELQRCRPSKNNQGRSSQQNVAEAKSYVLISTLPEELWTKFVVNVLWQHLRRLGLEEHDEKHPVFGNVKQAIETITKQRYIQKDRISGPEGDQTIYELAERALDDVVSGKLKQSIAQLVKDNPAGEASEAGV